MLNDHRADWNAAYKLFTGDVAYVWHAGVHAAEVADSLAAAEFQIRSQIVGAKPHFALSRGNYHWQHEPCWVCVRTGHSSRWRGDRTQSTLWQVANLNSFGGNRDETATGHGTQKPVELMRRPLLNHTERGDRVYDPFLGSGTTLIAAEQTERVCYGLEIDPRYVDVFGSADPEYPVVVCAVRARNYRRADARQTGSGPAEGQVDRRNSAIGYDAAPEGGRLIINDAEAALPCTRGTAG